jgi:hypothetical protein
MESNTPNSDSFLWHDFFNDAVLHCNVDKISLSLLITSEDDKTYLTSLSELEHEAVLADQFDQFKRAEELRLALEVAQQSGHYDDDTIENQDVVEGRLGDQNVEGSDRGGDADGGRYTPSNVYDYCNLSFTPIGVVTNSQDVVVETTMNLLPGSTVTAVSQMLDNPLAFLKSHTESTFPSSDVTPKGDVPVPNV